MVSGSPDYLQHISLTCTFSPNLCFGTLIISSVCVSLLQYMHTNVPDVFCGGDLAMFPLAMAKNRMVNIGHWQMAQAQGKAGNRFNWKVSQRDFDAQNQCLTFTMGSTKAIKTSSIGSGTKFTRILGEFILLKAPKLTSTLSTLPLLSPSGWSVY